MTCAPLICCRARSLRQAMACGVMAKTAKPSFTARYGASWSSVRVRAAASTLRAPARLATMIATERIVRQHLPLRRRRATQAARSAHRHPRLVFPVLGAARWPPRPPMPRKNGPPDPRSESRATFVQYCRCHSDPAGRLPLHYERPASGTTTAISQHQPARRIHGEIKRASCSGGNVAWEGEALPRRAPHPCA